MHNAVRNGLARGVVVATSIWLCIAGVDALAGEPFRTFAVVGGIPELTVLHHVLTLAYGVLIVAGVHTAARQPLLGGGLGIACVVVAVLAPDG